MKIEVTFSDQFNGWAISSDELSEQEVSVLEDDLSLISSVHYDEDGEYDGCFDEKIAVGYISKKFPSADVTIKVDSFST